MKRRTFLIEAGKSFPIVAGATYVLACGGDSTTGPAPNPTPGPTPQPTPTPLQITVTSTVDNGHAHDVSVPRSDLGSGTDHMYTTSTAGGHTHRVTLTGAQLMMIQNGASVTVTSTVDAGHDHDFTFRI